MRPRFPLSWLVGAALTAAANAQDPPPDVQPPAPRSPFGFELVTAGLHQFDSDLDGGGSFAVTRWFVEPGISWARGPDLVVAAGVSALREHYSFSGSEGLAGLEPWDDVTTLGLSGFARYGFRDDWTLFAIPSLRFSAEDGASLADGVHGGLLAGVAYRFSERLSLGPGFGYLTEIEDDASIFPIVLVDWEITEELSLRTGGGTGASRGPGLELLWELDERFSLAVGARYEEQRFRLDANGVAPRGVGEERAVPLYASLTHRWLGGSELSVLAGVDLAGELLLDDENGRRLASERYDPAPFVGLLLRARF